MVDLWFTPDGGGKVVFRLLEKDGHSAVREEVDLGALEHATSRRK